MGGKAIQIGNRKIGEDHPVFFIAEAGVNHNGDVDLGKELVAVAKEAGADAVKVQTFRTENIIIPSAPKSSYHIETTGAGQSWFDLLKSQELSKKDHEILIEHANHVGIMFLSTPYDTESVDLLVELEIAAFKVASTDANNIPLLRYIASQGRPIILSTAMCTLEEVEESVSAIRDAGCQDLIVLHCTANYPACLEDANLRAMVTMGRELGLPVGYSDHVPGLTNPIAATALGAVVYEAHLTLDKNMPGPDHRSSLDPDELAEVIRAIRATETALGNAAKTPTESETENRIKLRKSIVAKLDISAGTIVTSDMLTTKRPGSGLAPKHLESLVGKKANVLIRRDALIESRWLG
jgi:N-acetylneuraminate synthase/N,N'-diacetyllegionaminate synthase